MWGINVSKAFSFAKENHNQSWWFQLCCCHCDDTFVDFMSYRERMSHKCMVGSTLLSNFVSVVPIQVLCDSH